VISPAEYEIEISPAESEIVISPALPKIEMSVSTYQSRKRHPAAGL